MPEPTRRDDIRILRPVLGSRATPRLMRTIYEQLDYEQLAAAEIVRGEWSTRYGSAAAAQYGVARGTIGQEVQYLDRIGHLVTRRRPAMKPARASGGTRIDPAAPPLTEDARIREAFTVMQLDTREAQAVYMLYAAQPPPSPTMACYIRALAYLDEQASRLERVGMQDGAARVRATSRAIKADPDHAAAPPFAALFLAAWLHAGGEIEASARL